jgi:predicted transcriptional regulator
LPKRDGGDENPAVRRSTSEVLQEILAVAPATKSGIRFTVGLNHSQAKRYLPYLISEGYLSLSVGEKGPAIYEISPKGHKLLTILNELSEMVDT